MKFLIDASMPRDTGPLLAAAGHTAVDVRDIGLTSASDDEIAAYAQANRLCIVTRDHDFSDIRNYAPNKHSGIVLFETPDQIRLPFLLAMIERFAQDAALIAQLSGRLAVVDPWRTRLRS